MKPWVRVWAHWARIWNPNVDAFKVTASWIGVELCIKNDQQPDWRPEFERVQGAKVVHRMASEPHKTWDPREGLTGEAGHVD